jgi:hypothetical protein
MSQLSISAIDCMRENLEWRERQLLTVEILPSAVNILSDKKSNNPCLSFQRKNPVGKNQLVDHMRFYAFPVIVRILADMLN